MRTRILSVGLKRRVGLVDRFVVVARCFDRRVGQRINGAKRWIV